jgi:DNA-binding NtrC family response regulator
MVSGLMESQKPVLDKSLDVIENAIIRRTLERFGFNESKAAQFLGMTEHSFGQKIMRLAIARTTDR